MDRVYVKEREVKPPEFSEHQERRNVLDCIFQIAILVLLDFLSGILQLIQLQVFCFFLPYPPGRNLLSPSLFCAYDASSLDFNIHP